MALNASLARQFEFVQQQWISYGNDARLGNEKDLLLATTRWRTLRNSGRQIGRKSAVVLYWPANFVELRGGDYFFIPSITLWRCSSRLVDPR